MPHLACREIRGRPSTTFSRDEKRLNRFHHALWERNLIPEDFPPYTFYQGKNLLRLKMNTTNTHSNSHLMEKLKPLWKMLWKDQEVRKRRGGFSYHSKIHIQLPVRTFYCYPEEKGQFLETMKKKKESYFHTVDVGFKFAFKVKRLLGNIFHSNICFSLTLM